MTELTSVFSSCVSDHKSSVEPLTLEQAIELAYQWYEQAGLSERVHNNRKRLLNILRGTLPQSPPRTWTPSDMTYWWRKTEASKAKATDRNDLLGTLRKMLSILFIAGELELELTVHLDRVALPGESALPSREHIKEIVSEIRSGGTKGRYQRANMIEFLAYSGCRPLEATRLRWRDIGKEFISIAGVAKRIVPISEPMLGLLDEMGRRKPSELVFTLVSPNWGLKASSIRLGFPPIRTRDLRYVFATICIETGESAITVGEWLGYRDGAALARKAQKNWKRK